MRRRDALRAGGALIGAGLLGGRGAGSGAAGSGRGAADGATGDRRRRQEGADGAGYEPLGSVDIAGAREAVVDRERAVAYLALTTGYGVVDVSDPANPEVLAERRELLADTEAGPMQQIYDVKVAGDTLAVVGPANPVREGAHGAVLVDVTDPANPRQRAFYPTEHPIHNCFLDGSTLYLTGNGLEGNPLVVVDVGGAEPTELARWALTDFAETWRDVPSSIRPLHDVWVNEGLAALVYWDAGTYLLDVSDPASPTHVGTVPAGDPGELADPPRLAPLVPPGNHHYAATDAANDLLAIGKESWAARVDGSLEGGPSGIDLYDLSDPTSPTHLSSIAPPSSPDPTFDGFWTTAHNFEFEGGTLYSSWYDGGVKRHDVSDPANPVEETWWADPEATKFWTARVHTPGESFVASSMDTDSATGGLYTFPDEPGTGGALDVLGQAGGATGMNASSGTGTSTSSETPTRSPSPTPTTTPTATATDASTVVDAPGFGALAALGGLGVGVGLGAWRRRSDREEP